MVWLFLFLLLFHSELNESGFGCQTKFVSRLWMVNYIRCLDEFAGKTQKDQERRDKKNARTNKREL